jgi:hypothetical protein
MTAPVLDIKDAINDAVSSILPPADAAVVPEETVAAPPAPDAEAEDAPEESAPEETPDTEDAAEEIALPEGYVAVPTVSEGLATEFTLKDAEGEVEIPDLVVEYKANGKVRQDRLDQVVKLAQWGVYNQERELKVQQDAQQVIEEAQQMIAEREKQMERLLTDEEFLYAVREAYEAENSPEKRADRAEQQMAALRVQHQLESINSSGEQFYGQEVTPALQMITKALPSISEAELEAKLEMAMQAHVEVAPNGIPYVSPSRYDAIRQYIVEDLALWAQAAHARRVQPAMAQQANAELDRARVEAQKAKRMVGQKLKPTGSNLSSAERPKAPTKPATVDDAVNSALSSVLSSLS